MENKIKDELQNEGLYKEYVAMSLMDILAKSAAVYLNKDFHPEYRAIVVNTSERAKYANVLREALEFSNLRLLDLSDAEYMQFERTAALFLNALRNDEYCAYPQTQRGVNLITERRFVCGLYRSFYAAYKESQPNIVINLAQIILGEFSEHTMNKWLKSERRLCNKKEAINLASRRANKESDKYFR